MTKYKIGILFFTAFIIGITSGLLIRNTRGINTEYTEKHSGQKRLTNKLLDFDIPPSNELGDYKNKLEQIVDTNMANKNATRISVYYRDLNNGPWVGLYEEEKFIPASLLKIPLMMIYYKNAEKKPSILKKKYKFIPGEFNQYSVTQHYDPKVDLEEGKEYTVEELIERMIVYSDNNALFILASHADPDEQRELFTELGFKLPSELNASAQFVSVRNIGSFFRVLYNATYLNEEMSEKALQLLTKTDFKKGITAGVPSDVTVAQKYGERDDNGIMELHDCGIVYFPNHPYIICIMTQGTNYEKLSNVIKDISSLTYEKVKRAN